MSYSVEPVSFSGAHSYPSKKTPGKHIVPKKVVIHRENRTVFHTGECATFSTKDYQRIYETSKRSSTVMDNHSRWTVGDLELLDLKDFQTDKYAKVVDGWELVDPLCGCEGCGKWTKCISVERS